MPGLRLIPTMVLNRVEIEAGGKVLQKKEIKTSSSQIPQAFNWRYENSASSPPAPNGIRDLVWPCERKTKCMEMLVKRAA